AELTGLFGELEGACLGPAHHGFFQVEPGGVEAAPSVAEGAAALVVVDGAGEVFRDVLALLVERGESETGVEVVELAGVFEDLDGALGVDRGAFAREQCGAHALAAVEGAELTGLLEEGEGGFGGLLDAAASFE